jgi:excinuclease ABC subunit C
MLSEALDEKTRNLPDSPGVYLMRNDRGKVIYVGKAKSLRKRVRSYFQKGDDGRMWSSFLAAHVDDVDVIVTDTEKEAIILEDSAIKEHRPRYNIRLKDDKSFLRLKLTIKDEYPRLLITRKIKRDGAMYFGPYSSAYAARETFRVINKYFMLRKCSNDTFSRRCRPCIYNGMGLCMGPCCGKADKATYAQLVQNVISFLQGKNQELIETLRARMQESSENLQFEIAAKYRDQIQAIEKTIERQKVASADLVDRDFFGIYHEAGVRETGPGGAGPGEAGIREMGRLGVAVLVVREGKIIGSVPYHFPEVKVPTEEALGSILTQFYSGEHGVPKEVALPLEPENKDAFEQWLSEKKGERVTIIVPQRGDKRQLLEMAETNAKNIYEEHQRAEMAAIDILEELQRALSLRKRPERIEAFDISNISGQLAVGSMVVFEDGKPKKSDYRRFKIRTVEGADDYAMMREVLTRHLMKATTEGPMPSLLIVDGGKGQLNVALSVFEDLQMIEQDAIGIAKEKILYRRKDELATKEADKIYIPHRKDAIILRPGSPALHLLQHVRDEAHRFAITYHKKIRARAHTRSILDGIRGIGPRRRTALLKHFGSVKRIAEASEEEIASAGGIPLALARDVKIALAAQSAAPTGSD